MIIVDALAMSVAQDLAHETTENLRRIRASLTTYHCRTGPQPLGDEFVPQIFGGSDKSLRVCLVCLIMSKAAQISMMLDR